MPSVPYISDGYHRVVDLVIHNSINMYSDTVFGQDLIN